MGLKGKYEWLKPYCALGFDSNEHAATDIINDDDFFTCKIAKAYLDSANLRNNTIMNAKITLIFYLVECCYDIILSKQHNVSESPGYEKIVK